MRNMLLRLLFFLVPLLLELVQADATPISGKCLFEMEAILYCNTGEQKKKKTLRLLGEFETLSTSSVKDCLESSNLSQEEWQTLSESLEIMISGYCIPDPGWSVWAIHTNHPVSNFQMKIQNVTKGETDLIDFSFSHTKARLLLRIAFTWQGPIELDKLNIEFEATSVIPQVPIRNTSSDTNSYILFPRTGMSSEDLDWPQDHDKKAYLDDEYICLFDLRKSDDIWLESSVSDMYIAERKEALGTLLGFSTNPDENFAGETRRLVYVNRYVPAAYHLNYLPHRDNTLFLGCVLA